MQKLLKKLKRNSYSMKKEKEAVVISLGGSILVPGGPDPDFVIKIRDLVLEWVKKDKRFLIIVGGGKVCRVYQEALSKTLDNADSKVLDWMGIYTTYLNAQFLRLTFGGEAYEDIITDPGIVSTVSHDIVIGSGWKPGFSTDADAVFVAEQVGAKKIINLSSVDFVYDSDPMKNPNAKKFETISWDEYRSIIPSEWTPGENLPFDPIASKRAEELGMELAFISGRNLESLNKYLSGSPFTGTIIK